MTISSALPGPHNIHRTELANGITVLAYENFAAQSVVITGALINGSQFENSDQHGLAAFTASALMRGTQTRDFDTLNTALEDIGADIGFSSGVQRAGFFGKSLAEDLPLLLDLLSDLLQHPTFPDVHVDRLRGEIITGLRMREQDARYRVGRAFGQAFYPPDHIMARGVRGTPESLSRLRAEDLRAFHQLVYHPQGMILVIVGAVRAEEAFALARAALENWQHETPIAPDISDGTNPLEKQSLMVPLPGKSQVEILLGMMGPKRLSPDYMATQLANSIFGQFGMSGRIGERVREELGLAYHIHSQIDSGFMPGPWSISAGVAPESIDEAIAAIREEVRRLRDEPVSQEDLADNQSYFVGQMPLRLETNEGIAGSLLNIEQYHLGLDYLHRFKSLVYGVTLDEVQAAAQRYLDPDQLVVALAGTFLDSDKTALQGQQD